MGRTMGDAMTERDGELRGAGVIPSSALAKWARQGGEKRRRWFRRAVWGGELTKRGGEQDMPRNAEHRDRSEN